MDKVSLVDAIASKLGLAVEKLEPLGGLLVSEFKARCLMGAIVQGLGGTILLVTSILLVIYVDVFFMLGVLTAICFIVACFINIANVIAPHFGSIEQLLGCTNK